MTIAEKIQHRINRLPAPLQAEVLDFVEFLLSRIPKEQPEEEWTDAEDWEWSNFSLTMAMRGTENEDGPEYSPADLKERL